MIYDKVRKFFQKFPVSSRISWEPGSQVPREYPALYMKNRKYRSRKYTIGEQELEHTLPGTEG